MIDHFANFNFEKRSSETLSVILVIRVCSLLAALRLHSFDTKMLINVTHLLLSAHADTGDQWVASIRFGETT